MKSLVLIVLVCSSVTVAARPEWTPSVPVTSGNHHDTHPAFVVSNMPMGPPGSREWIAFARQDTGEVWKNIYVMPSGPAALTWSEQPIPITQDTAVHDYPSIARSGPPPPAPEHLMVAWEMESEGRTYTCFSHNEGELWMVPQPVDRGGGTDHTPCVAPADSGFIMVWTRYGKVHFSRFAGGFWSAAAVVSAADDSTCAHPQVVSLGGFAQPYHSIAVWEVQKLPGTDHALLFSLGADSGWTVPDTLAWSGDNRNPRFYKVSFPGRIDVSWESNRTGDWEIFASGGDVWGGSLNWTERDVPISSNPGADDRQAALQVAPIITAGSERRIFSTASAWSTSSDGSDSIGVRALGDPGTSYRSPAPGTIDRNPDISAGLFLQGWVRVWTVWENNSTGLWNLYGSYADFSVDVEEEPASVPAHADLMQNYPNPFNGETRIGYRVSPAPARPSEEMLYSVGTGGRTTWSGGGLGSGAGDGEWAVLRVFDLLGREVATLVNETKRPGTYSVRWDAGGMPSGVYFYRLTAGDVTLTRRLILLR